ncbi:Zinc finger, RING-type [Corchorus capsularis]|uniref:E3 ubiquitin-protein ligase RMA n=1 Tax=Corchorus capsularis TaxID=210143 RepID=A0A1R3GNZ6_COCAP|nr:Zinc finger, RING-type [Corchorus capsularis]
MAIEQYFEEAVAHNHLSGQGKNSLENWKNSPDSVTDSDENPMGGFDCNICLETVQDPVVTLCGHLYCWPCIYKWLHFQTISSENQDHKQQQCPVCKAEVSLTTIIPLYGRGQTNKASRGKAPQFGLVIPKRPVGPACGVGTPRSPSNSIPNSPGFAQQFNHRSYSYQPPMYYSQQGSYPASPMLSSDGMTINVLDPVTRIFGEMVYTRIDDDEKVYIQIQLDLG